MSRTAMKLNWWQPPWSTFQMNDKRKKLDVRVFIAKHWCTQILWMTLLFILEADMCTFQYRIDGHEGELNLSYTSCQWVLIYASTGILNSHTWRNCALGTTAKVANRANPISLGQHSNLWESHISLVQHCSNCAWVQLLVAIRNQVSHRQQLDLSPHRLS